MSQHIFVLVWIGIMAIFASLVKVKKTELVDGIETTRYYWSFAIIAFLPLIIYAGLRPTNFGDKYVYMRQFGEVPSSLSEIKNYLSDQTKDYGFSILEIIIKVFFSNDTVVFFTIVAAIQGFLLLFFFRQYSPNYLFSIFLFVASTDYLSWMYNGIRQFIAVTIIIAATPLLLKKKYIPLILVIGLAATFHLSALLMIPIVFIVQGKAWNKKTLLIIVLILFAILFLDLFTNILDDSLSNTQYSNVVSDYRTDGDDGTNPLRALVYAVPTILALFGRKKLDGLNNQLLNICINMSIVSTGLYVLSVFTSGVFIGRLPIYCSLFNYILLPWEINILFEEKIRPIIFSIATGLYLLFYYYQICIIWHLN